MARSRPHCVLAFDKDGTLVPKERRSLMHVIHELGGLPPDALARRDAGRDRYMSSAIAGTLSDEEALRWIFDEARILVDYGLQEDQMRRALESVDLRPGADETLLRANELGIPTVIISYGIADFIEAVLRRLGLRAEVRALRLCWRGGKVVGCQPETVVHPATKGVWARRFARGHGLSYDRVFGIGDSRGDRTLGLRENRFGIAGDEKERAFIADHFSEVAITRDFVPVRDWLRRRTGLPF